MQYIIIIINSKRLLIYCRHPYLSAIHQHMIYFFRVNWFDSYVTGFVIERVQYKCNVHVDWKKVMQLYCEVPSKYLRFHIWSHVKGLVLCTYDFELVYALLLPQEMTYDEGRTSLPTARLSFLSDLLYTFSWLVLLWMKRKGVRLN